MKIALKVAYFGDNFAGSQYQPDARTVEGELLKALKNFKVEDLKIASRTDAGVHAYGQVVAFDCNDLVTPRMLNSFLPEDVTAWAWAKVDEKFNPKKAKSRTYLYVTIAKNLKTSEMKKAAEILIGTHDFSNFTKKFGEGKSCVRTIYSADVKSDGESILFEIEGNAFTWNMVRCLVTALLEVGSGRKNLSWFEDLLNLKRRERVEPVPAYGLILKDVKYDGVEFEVDNYAFETLKKRLEKRVFRAGVEYKLFSYFIK
ncbi:MAG: tRNA pseudouridine(38-40) synthase TruA [Archaeoglobaceae archaeon]|nr:tRNA pseudouridine(38-40) synthase TruA [Archaeoglobaceae archaeon]MCX8151812.1 tRNA pseudouridine(38-40) synthase TruA [Archaeoglobaceae archaeon]MDW8014356.1 tRNA pseudouridine(38-40) synthase TruA [Archaeoglobaceae archaeon]